jgi:uncharacterized protein YdaU (DUF1376 family)
MELPYFPLYVKDFVADSKVVVMTTEEIGCYILLLGYAWQNSPPACIPTDDTSLARITRLTSDRWAECKSKVLACFDSTTDSRYLSQKRLRDEFNKAARISKAKSQGGKNSSKKRKVKNDDTQQESLNGLANKRASPGSGSESGSNSLERNGGVGERKGGEEKCPETPELVAQAFWFHQSPKKDNEFSLGEEVRAMVEAGFSLPRIWQEIQAKRDKSEFFWQLKKRLEKDRPKPGEPSNPSEDPHKKAEERHAKFAREREEEAKRFKS